MAMVRLRALLATLGVLFAAWAALAWLVDREGVTPRDLYRVDAQEVLVVLGARVEADGSPSPTLAARVKHAVKQLGPRQVLLFSGGVGKYGASEASVARALAVKLGVDPSRCLVEEESHSTAQNATFSLEVLRARFPRGFHVIVVSDPYHLPRARRLFERISGSTVSTSPVLNAPRHHSFPHRVWWAMREVPAIFKDLR
jgi:uncharacterized SAM-binding protein YcdF (DUF218 family)